ncbi:GntR family transcriptional regulator [Celeribacter baekdonensis]|uniref:GntR family transcriptional regulator n=1 Tax=Celeribacter baekdonensis TaxID=875171 RepID=UPI0030D9AB27|tara:strand:- start:93506 stop:94201 length:696 start_codon:yes stop_codon:yes gene_type:complete
MVVSTIPEFSGDSDGTTQEYAYSRLRNAIIVGAFAPGTALTIRGLAQELNLSPTPIREAVRRLSSENAIQVLGNRRLKVPDMTLGRFEELAQLRISLETHATERAFPYISNVFIEHMRALDDQMDVVLAAGDLDALTRINQGFHKDLYRLNPHQAVVPMIESVWLQLGPFQRQAIKSIKTTAMVDRHKEMLAAMEARDVTALCAALESDIRDGSILLGRAMLQSQTEGTVA